MNTTKITNFMLVLSLLLIASVGAFGQSDPRSQVESSYDVTLQLVIGSNEAGQGIEMPASLSSMSHQLKGSMPFANYRVAGTFLGRVYQGGNFEYKSMSNIFGESADLRSQSFQEWSLVNLRGLPTAKGGHGFQAQVFRFGARVPVATGASVKDEIGKSTPIVNYESIGLTLAKIGVAENVPTLMGTLSLPGANGTIFLVMTVKSVDM